MTGDLPLPPRPGPAVLEVSGRLESSNVPALCDRLRALVESGGAGDVLCDVGSLVNCDLRALEALARLGLTAKQLGCELSLWRPSWQLVQLINLAGLEGIFVVYQAGQQP